MNRIKLYFLIFTSVFLTAIKAQDKKTQAPAAASQSNPPGGLTPPKTGPKPYKEVITDKAKTFSGLFTVHKVEDK